MDDLIRREDAIKKIMGLNMQVYEGNACVGTRTYLTKEEIIYAIDELPSAEPEQKKGKWIDGMLYYDFDESEWEKVKCSVCENFVTKQIFYHDNKYHYCPYCGADMRGEYE